MNQRILIFAPIAFFALAGLCAAAEGNPAAAQPTRDIRSVAADLTVPPMTREEPAPGRRVRQVTPGYEQTQVYHALYLPTDWQPGRRYPVLVEYMGNGPYHGAWGDYSSGRLEDTQLGYGISAGKRFLWVALPYLNGAGTDTVTQWWGDPGKWQVEPTLDYCRKTVRGVCEKFGGDPDALILTGFSRGAIACNYLGLYNDEIARLWRAFIPFSHYDGLERWPYHHNDRASAVERLKRLGGRSQFILSESGFTNAGTVDSIERYLKSTGVEARVTLMGTGFRNHDAAWILRPSPARDAVRKWLDDLLAKGPVPAAR